MACPGGSEHHVRYKLIIVYDGKYEETRNFTGGPISTLLLTSTPHASRMPWDSLKMIMSCICHVGCQSPKGICSTRVLRDFIQWFANFLENFMEVPASPPGKMHWTSDNLRAQRTPETHPWAPSEEPLFQAQFGQLWGSTQALWSHPLRLILTLPAFVIRWRCTGPHNVGAFLHFIILGMFWPLFSVSCPALSYHTGLWTSKVFCTCKEMGRSVNCKVEIPPCCNSDGGLGSSHPLYSFFLHFLFYIGV